MKYTVILSQEADHDVLATVPGLPDCSVKAKTRDQALKLVRETITRVISRSEIVQVDVPVESRAGGLHNNTPWEFFGAFKDDVTWGKLFDEIEHNRNEVQG